MRSPRPHLLLLSLVFVSTSFAQIPPGYYDTAQGLTGQPLRVALKNIIDNHTVVSYASLWNYFDNTDATAGGKVWDMYSDVPGGTPAYLFTFGSDQCGNYSGEGDCYNREHSVPQSWFNSNSPMVSDLFHLYPTDGYVNNMRDNYPYGEVDAPTWVSTNGGKLGPCVIPGYVGTAFEPIDAYKGDLARTYFYMMTRYMDDVQNWTSFMFTGNDLRTWSRNMLLQWSADDPVSAKEIDRNNAIYGIQDNRNPFIDHPEWITSIWTSTVGVEEATVNDTRLWCDDAALHISTTAPIDGTLYVSDATGRLVLTQALHGAQSDVPLDVTPGVYIAQVVVNGTPTVLRFVR